MGRPTLKGTRKNVDRNQSTSVDPTYRPPGTSKPTRTLNMAPFKDEHMLIIAPGSSMTLAQLGLPESYTPAQHRFPTRMFPGEEPGQYEPNRIVSKARGKAPARALGHVAPSSGVPQQPPKEDVEMKDAASTAASAATGHDSADPANPPAEPAEEYYYEEDVLSEEGAVRPIVNGRIVNRPAFFAFLQHIYNTLSPPLHTPILIISQPCWFHRDFEEITRFVFEKFSPPGLNFVNAANAIAHGIHPGVQTSSKPTCLVVDVGKDKADISAVVDGLVEKGINQITDCGGELMTERLLELLGPKGFTREMCEQLKRSDITEILPEGEPLPGAATTSVQANSSVSASATKPSDSAPGETAPGNNTDEEGVLDVASIVTGNTSEYLANMEKEKVAVGKKGAVDPKQPKLPNSKKETATFQFQEFVEIPPEGPADAAKRYKLHTREITVGVERFLCATPLLGRPSLGCVSDIMYHLADSIFRTISAAPIARRGDLWNNILIVGAGSRVRGFNQALIALLTKTYLLLSPANTMFTSEIPSTMSTPLPTGGTNTPAPMAQGQPGPGFHPAAHGVNPLLVAATHNNPGMPPATPMGQGFTPRPSFHLQTPRSINQARLPEHWAEYRYAGNVNCPGVCYGPNIPRGGHGLEEGIMIGAHNLARVLFFGDQNQFKGYLSRADYNKEGPRYVHKVRL